MAEVEYPKEHKQFTPVAWTVWPEVEGRFEWLAWHIQRTHWRGDYAWEQWEKAELVEPVQAVEIFDKKALVWRGAD